MHKRSSTLLFTLLTAACSGSPSPAPTPAPAPSAEMAPKPAASASAAPATSAPAASASAAKTADVPPEKPEETPKGPFHWKDYAGPKVASKITGKHAWGVVPIGLSGDFSSAKIALLDLVKTEGDEHVFTHAGPEHYHVPAAMTRALEPAKGLTKGSAIMVNVAASSGFGRVTSVEKGDEGMVVKFKYIWVTSPSDGMVPDNEVIKLENKATYGAPIAYKEEKDWSFGRFLAADKDSVWVLGWSSKPIKVPAKDVKPMQVTKVFKKGDKVWADKIRLKPAKVVEVIEGGVGYKVKFDEDGNEDTLNFAQVTSPL